MHSKENPGNPKFGLFQLVKITPKWGIWTYRDQNLIYSEADQNTSTCQIWSHSFRVVLKKMLGNRQFGLFH